MNLVLRDEDGSAMMDRDIPFAPIATNVPYRLDYGRPGRFEPGELALLHPPQRGGALARDFVILIGIFWLFLAILMPSLSLTPRASSQISCASAMHQIILAASSYSEDHGGVFPNSFALLTGTPRYVTADAFKCVVADKQSIVVGSRGSFVYCGGNLTSGSAAASVVAYEHPSNHSKEELVNIGYKDGSVRIVGMAEATCIIAELQAGHNPPRAKAIDPPPTTSAQ